MYKIKTHNISSVINYVNNPDWRVVMTNYVCKYVKDHVYADNLLILKHLDTNIRQVITKILFEMSELFHTQHT